LENRQSFIKCVAQIVYKIDHESLNVQANLLFQHLKASVQALIVKSVHECRFFILVFALYYSVDLFDLGEAIVVLFLKDILFLGLEGISVGSKVLITGEERVVGTCKVGIGLMAHVVLSQLVSAQDLVNFIHVFFRAHQISFL
jgi:hypothetical protein